MPHLTLMQKILYLHAFLHNHECFKDMLTGNNRKTEGNLMESGSEPVAWMNIKGTKRNMTAEQGIIELMENFNLYFEQLKVENDFTRYLLLLFLGKHRFNNGVLKDSRLIHVSKNNHFRTCGHRGLKQQ